MVRKEFVKSYYKWIAVTSVKIVLHNMRNKTRASVNPLPVLAPTYK